MTSSLVRRCTLVGPVLLVGSLMTMPAEGVSQTVPSPIRRIEQGQEAGLFAGTVVAGRGRFGFGPGSGFGTGGRYSIELSGPLSLEGVLSALSMTRNVIDPELGEGARVAGEADALLVASELRFKFSLTGRRTWRGISPHVLIGGGFLFDAAGEQADDGRILEQDRFEFGNKFGGTVGGGVRWLVSDGLTLRGDAVVNLFQLETPSGFAEVDRGFDNVEEAQWTNLLQITFGAALRF